MVSADLVAPKTFEDLVGFYSNHEATFNVWFLVFVISFFDQGTGFSVDKGLRDLCLI